MKKIKVSFDGRNNNETWTILQLQEDSEPHLTITRHRRQLKITFENHRERERFLKGIALCRGKYEEDGFLRDVFLTATNSEELMTVV